MNDKLKTALIAASTALVVVLIVSFLRGTPPGNTIERVIRESVGAIPGNEVQGNEFVVGGARIISNRQTMAASNTPCAIKVQATSTIDRISILDMASFANSPLWVIGTSTSRTATGTALWSQRAAANAGMSVSVSNFATSSLSATAGTVVEIASSTNPILRPNDWINVNVVSTGGFTGSTEIRGACVFRLLEL